MRIGRTLPPAASPIPWGNILKATLAYFSNSTKPVQNIENELKNYFSVKYCFLISSGKAALTLILQSLQDITPHKNEVLIPAYTCFSVPAAIKKAGLNIKLCDMGSDSLDFDQKKLSEIAKKEALHKNLLCVLPTHLFGLPADVQFCKEIFSDDVAIVEDAAQAMGTIIAGKKLGILGDVGFFSLGRGKTLSTIEGGVIITNRDDIGLAIKQRISSIPKYTTVEKTKLLMKALLTNILQNPYLFWFPKSLPFLHLGETIYDPEFPIKQLTPLHALLAHNWRKNLIKLQNIRENNLRLFTDLELSKPMKVSSPWISEIRYPIRLPVLADSHDIRKMIVKKASRKGLGVMPAYPSPIDEINEIRNTFHDSKYPCAKNLSEQLITIPTHKYMRKKDYQKIQSLLYDCCVKLK